MTRQNKSGGKVQVTFQIDESADDIVTTLFVELPKGFAFASRQLCVSRDYTRWSGSCALSRFSRERGGYSVSFERKRQLRAWLSRVGRDIRAICAGQLTEWDKVCGEKQAGEPECRRTQKPVCYSDSRLEKKYIAQFNNKDPKRNCPDAICNLCGWSWLRHSWARCTHPPKKGYPPRKRRLPAPKFAVGDKVKVAAKGFICSGQEFVVGKVYWAYPFFKHRHYHYENVLGCFIADEDWLRLVKKGKQEVRSG